MDKLIELYKVYCLNCWTSDDYATGFELDWIPREILRSCYDVDFRFDLFVIIEAKLDLEMFSI